MPETAAERDSQQLEGRPSEEQSLPSMGGRDNAAQPAAADKGEQLSEQPDASYQAMVEHLNSIFDPDHWEVRPNCSLGISAKTCMAYWCMKCSSSSIEPRLLLVILERCRVFRTKGSGSAGDPEMERQRMELMMGNPGCCAPAVTRSNIMGAVLSSCAYRCLKAMQSPATLFCPGQALC